MSALKCSCKADAVAQMAWPQGYVPSPERGVTPVCERCLLRAKAIAAALGFYLAVLPLPVDEAQP